MTGYKIISYQVADSIDIKAIKPIIDANLLYKDSSELFYEMSASRYLYIFRYGVVSFLNYKPDEISTFFQ